MRWILILLTASSLATIQPLAAKIHSTPVEKAAETAVTSLCFFKPPQGWEIADPKDLSPRVKIAFLTNTGKGFCPSINLTVEKTSVSLPDYLKAVRSIHEQNRNNQWRALGRVRTEAGLAQLTEIDTTTEWGPVRMLQLILLKDGHAYVLTAAALREEFSNYYKEFQAAFRSMTLSSDLLSNIPQLERREKLKRKQEYLLASAKKALTTLATPENLLEDPLFQKKHWLPFQKSILNNFGDMGAFWQILALRNAQEKLLSLPSANPPENEKTQGDL
jgi:hypothetical protein